MNPAALKAQLLQAIRLKELDRAGWQRIGVPRPESVAAHSWGIGWLVLALRPDSIHLERSLALAIIHDLPEVLAGDITPADGISKEEKMRREAEALETLLQSHPRAEELRALWKEYSAGESPEARFVKACDKLDMALQAQRYEALHPELDLSEFVDSALERLSDKALSALVRA